MASLWMQIQFSEEAICGRNRTRLSVKYSCPIESIKGLTDEGQFQYLTKIKRSQEGTCNSYTMGCPPVRGDNPRALASGLSYVQVDKHGMTILYHLHQCRPCTSSDISC